MKKADAARGRMLAACKRVDQKLNKVRGIAEQLGGTGMVPLLSGGDRCAEATANLIMFINGLEQAFLLLAAAAETAHELSIAVQAAQAVKDQLCK